MYIPFFFDSWASATLYFFLAGVIAVGIWQFIQIKSGKVEKVRSLVPLGAVAVCIGFIGNFIKITGAFEAIEAAGDISPQIVAGAIKQGPPYVVLGFVILAVAFVFKYVNQR